KQLKPSSTAISIKKPSTPAQRPSSLNPLPSSPYKVGDTAATREAFGNALEALGAVNPLVAGLDADVKNSTYTDKFGKKFPNRFFENFIAEQNMLGTAAGLAACGKIPFVATFAAFYTRAYDFIRMAAMRGSNIKLVGTHVGVSIGEDGPSQMGLEDIAMMAAQPGVTVLYPADATCTYRLPQKACTAQRDGLHSGRSPKVSGSVRARRNVPDRRIEGHSPKRVGCPHDRRSGRHAL